MPTLTMNYHLATSHDAPRLAELNLQLIHDEGHRNPMNLDQLTDRMRDWLGGDYEAILFERDNTVVGYVLFRHEPEYVYVRHLFVLPAFRRQGIARQAIEWLWQHAWIGDSRLRTEVLVHNVGAREFWRSVGFRDYCITLESEGHHPHDTQTSRGIS
jgi:ribosomal protein S18 acetylase RimI-like enzyme